MEEQKFIVSTTLTEENTKAVDDILLPDISVPYIASEYLQGGDPVLEKLLDYLKNKNSATIAQNE